jgi:hypothetical protein
VCPPFPEVQCRAGSPRDIEVSLRSNSSTGCSVAGQSSFTRASSRDRTTTSTCCTAQDHDRIAALLAANGWKHAPEEDEDGYTGYERGTVRLELAFLARGENGQVYTPLQDAHVAWEEQVAEPPGGSWSSAASARAWSGTARMLASRRRGAGRPRDASHPGLGSSVRIPDPAATSAITPFDGKLPE